MKTKLLSLPSKFSGTTHGVPYYYDEEFITNGKFAVPRSIVKDDFKYCVDSPIAKNPNIQRSFGTIEEKTKRFIKTNHILDLGNFYARMFENPIDNETVYFQDQYIIHFGVIELFGKDESKPFICKNTGVIIMPCNTNTKK